ncbi:MAG: polysaccharide deacetylase family protein [Acidobacteriota bacterium]
MSPFRAACPSIWMYHHVEPAPLDPPTVFSTSYLTPEEFDRHLALLEGWGYRTVTLAQAARGEARGKCVVLTFDDGCACFLEHAVPLLRQRSMTATLFAVSDALGGENAWDRAKGERRESLLDGDALRALAEEGFEIASHSRSHRPFEEFETDDFPAETAGSKADLEATIGRPVDTFCYPWGRFDGRYRQAVQAAGYRAAVSIHGVSGTDRRDPLALPRMILRPGETTFELRLKASGAYRWWSRLPRLGLLGALRNRRRRQETT